MAKRKTVRRSKPTPKRGRSKATRPSVKRPIKKTGANRRKAAATGSARSKPARRAPKRQPASRPRKADRPKKAAAMTRSARKAPRLDRVRRTLDGPVPSPPSSLDMDRHPSAARSGRAGTAAGLRQHRGMSSDITGGDVDVDVENAYFSGDEAPGGDNPAPDEDIVDDIGKALGVQYADNEELKGSDKIVERDKHRWEMDPASSEDYKDRK